MDDMISLMKHDFRIARLTEEDARGGSDHFNSLRDLILANEEMYPGIGHWFRNKVVPGIRSAERVALVGYLNERPAVSAVIKRGEDSKFCHLKIREDLQDISMGDLFFTLMAFEVRNFAKTIHFTLPESLWERKAEFFKSFSFVRVEKAPVQYRNGDEELRSSARCLDVLRGALRKRHKIIARFSEFGQSVTTEEYSFSDGLLMSIHPEHARKIVKGEKTVEIRRKFSKKHTGATVKIFSTRPEQSLIGEAKIEKVASDTPERIWAEYGDRMGCARKEFDEYVGGLSIVHAIILTEIRPYKEVIPISQLEYIVDSELRPPQSFFALEKNRPWAEAVSVATFVQNTLRTPNFRTFCHGS